MILQPRAVDAKLTKQLQIRDLPDDNVETSPGHKVLMRSVIFDGSVNFATLTQDSLWNFCAAEVRICFDGSVNFATLTQNSLWKMAFNSLI